MTKEKAIEQFKYAIDLIKQDGKDYLDERDIPMLEMGIQALENQKTGHWIRITNGAIREKYTCSECGRQIEDCGIENLLPIKYPYCHCGAKMEGENK